MTAMLDAARAVRPQKWAIAVLVATAVALYAVLVPLHAVAYATSLPLAFVLGAGVCGAPLLALARPRSAIAVFCASAFALPLAVGPGRDASAPWPWSVPALLAFSVFVFVVTVRHGWRFGLFPLVVSLIGSLTAPLLRPDGASPDAAGADLIVTASIAGAAFLVAVLLAGRIRLGEELTSQRELTAQEQERRLLVEERARIARELHDVVAHSMSLIQVQASTARYRLADLAPDASDEFDAIAGVARTSLSEMRHLLGVLRTDGETPQLAPQQGIAEIPALVASIRRAGVSVDLVLEDPPSEAPLSVQITAYRVVQEALSNAVRHAPGSAVLIEVGADGDAVTVRVHNTRGDARDAGAAGSAPADRAGHGLRGMQERVALLAGSLRFGPDPSGGWTVSAVLPWTAATWERP